MDWFTAYNPYYSSVSFFIFIFVKKKKKFKNKKKITIN